MDTEDPAEHMESAHHAKHAQDPFDKRVAATMAVIAVILAITAMLSHAANGKTLAKQIESGKSKTESTDQYALYQAKKNRAHEDLNMIALLEATDAAKSAAEAAQIDKWKKEIAKYDMDAEVALKAAQEAAMLSKEQAEVSEAQEHKASVLDLAELTVQVSLVLCSVAILAKRHAFWFAGMTVAAVGIIIGAYGLTMHSAGPAAEPATQAHAP